MGEVLLKVEDLQVYYGDKGGWLNKNAKRVVKAVDGISFDVYRGETFGIVGESGCGKSTTGKAIIHLINPTGGKIFFGDSQIDGLTRKDRYNLSKKIQIIFQDSYSSLDPRFNVGRTIEEPMLVHKMGTPAERKERVYKLMEDVGLRKDQFERYPHEFSGGQRQRIGIARALSLNPELIVCDEPVSALDVSIQAQILNLMKNIQKQYNLTYVFISHNLSVVRHICDRIAVMYLGHIVEMADKKDIFENPKHPYTKALLGSIPVADPNVPCMEEMLEGDVPSPANPPTGCVFNSRCKYAVEECRLKRPELVECGEGHTAACLRLNEI
ncbi:ABC transporter ATP-binding protein [Tyzzerella sp. OttesenSCG-928-J15]|nr:ABC transporter ATP-binding protein [Tyzzerella sp. OttesenSCG-928-J15]